MRPDIQRSRVVDPLIAVEAPPTPPAPAPQRNDPPPCHSKTPLVAVVVGAVFLVVVFAGSPRGTRTTSSSSGGSYDQTTYRAAAKELVRQRLRDPGSAEFSDIRVVPGIVGRSTIVCGSVNSRNAFGGMSGPQRFVVGGTVAIEEEIGAVAMNELWARFC